MKKEILKLKSACFCYCSCEHTSFS